MDLFTYFTIPRARCTVPLPRYSRRLSFSYVCCLGYGRHGGPRVKRRSTLRGFECSQLTLMVGAYSVARNGWAADSWACLRPRRTPDYNFGHVPQQLGRTLRILDSHFWNARIADMCGRRTDSAVVDGQSLDVVLRKQAMSTTCWNVSTVQTVFIRYPCFSRSETQSTHGCKM